MVRFTFRSTTPLALFTLFLMLLSGCVDEDSLFSDRPFSDDPPASAGGFLGYVQGQAGQPTCAQCHATSQAQWSGTAHAKAWEGLQGSGHADDFCEGCHAVSERGNAAEGDVGWTATGDSRYHDVQCESCHGAGEGHVRSPANIKPIPSLVVDTLLNGCGECHNGDHHPFVEQWELSGHANVVGFAAERAECAGCHRGQGTLLAWGVRSDYLEKDSEEHLPVVCGVCHDPHDATFESQLRFPVNTPDVTLHLCARCHNRRSVPDPSSSHGLEPHSPETELLVGEAGWIPPGADLDFGSIVATHGTENNEKLCATCHVDMYTVTDAVTGEFVFQSVGHTFRAIPCVDEEGKPSGESDCPLTTEARTFGACVDSGCHSSEEGTLTILELRGGTNAGLAEDLLAQLLEVDPNLDGPGGEIDAEASTFTLAEGAFFNHNLALHGGSIYPATAHNSPWIKALLEASIAAVERQYGVSPP